MLGKTLGRFGWGWGRTGAGLSEHGWSAGSLMSSLMENMLLIAKPSSVCSGPEWLAAELGWFTLLNRVALETHGWHLSLSPEWLLPLRVRFYTQDKTLPCIRKSTIKTAHQLSSSLFLNVG